MAEYEACILGLNLAVDMNIKELLVIGDSDLLVHQVKGDWAIKNTKILPYLYHVKEMMKRFTKIEFTHVPRIQNEFVDALATLSSMIQHPDKSCIDPIPIRIHNQPAYCTHVEEVDENPWFHDIKEDHIDCRLGDPKSIITNNATNLNSDLMNAMCGTFKIKHKNSTAYMPQINGAVEAANKNMKKILRMMVENHKQWHEKLPFALLGYRTTVRTSTVATPYLLVYGTEAVIPAEVEQLALIDGKRINAVCDGQLYQNRMSKAFNKRLKPRQFAPGQLVLKRIFPHQDEAKGKLSPNWQGPYMVHRVLRGEALILVEMDGEIWPKPINSDAVKRYYV
ncbi:uncharacterized protein [Nicotiana tomentosiformis]|uniref:uncharacterized protein n=1 Tax=Nicotiana tomentosiformis TaxID=4098 RepID=UPI00388C3D1A